MPVKSRRISASKGARAAIASGPACFTGRASRGSAADPANAGEALLLAGLLLEIHRRIGVRQSLRGVSTSRLGGDDAEACAKILETDPGQIEAGLQRGLQAPLHGIDRARLARRRGK